MTTAMHVETVQWQERTMTLKGRSWMDNYTPMTQTVAYAHVAACALSLESLPLLTIVAGCEFQMLFQCATNARDAAGELARRMEACR